MSRSFLVLAAIAAGCAACSSSVIEGSPTGSGGGGTTTKTTTATGTGGGSSSSTVGTGGGSGTGGSSTGGGDAGACSDPTNPMFKSCVVPFLAGCYAPDTSGTCTDMNGVVTWSDGSRYVTKGAMPGLYGPGETTPCISIVLAPGMITATKGTQTLVYTADSATMTAKIDCPDGTSFTVTSDQATAFNRCKGLNCP